ncbi:MAG: DUF2318 domain-containing protein [bacterium]|nr:DUF2318 domain-containing protein [bacterium]
MKRVTPVHALIVVAAFMAVILFANQLASGAFGGHRFERVRPGDDGMVRIAIGDLERLQVRFYRFLNSGNQEVRFLVGRDEEGVIQVGFDAGRSHQKVGRGFSYQDGWIVDNKCETTTRLSTLNDGGRGCRPIPLKHSVAGDELIITESDVLEGWRYFR